VYGSGRSNTPYTTLKIAVVAAMASAKREDHDRVAPGVFCRSVEQRSAIGEDGVTQFAKPFLADLLFTCF